MPCVAVSPLIGGRAVKGPLDRMLLRLAGGTTPAHVTQCYKGLIDVLVIDRRGRAGRAPRRMSPLVVSDTLMGDREAAAGSPTCSTPRGGLVKVALLGGTGSFGTALAVRLRAAGYDVVIGSRDAERARAAAAVLGVEGATNEDAARAADLVVIATQADRARRDGAVAARRDRLDAGAISRSRLLFTKDGVLPTPEATSIAERIQESRGPVVAGLHSLAASNLGGDEAPEEDALVCGDDPTRRRSRWSSPETSLPAARSTLARSRAPGRSRD